jgi:chemosensory pili system protein ChpA (sensor histidine kinase/response regulator)
MDTSNDFDLGPFTWVKGEIDNALAVARRQLDGWNGSDLSPLKTAATHLHQVYGALQIVDLQGVSQVCEATERLLSAMEQRPGIRHAEASRAALDAIQAMQHYLDELGASGEHAELALAPTYRVLLSLLGEPARPPSDLFYPDLDIRISRMSPEPGLDEPHRYQVLRRARRDYQRGLLQWLTGRDASGGMHAMTAAVRAIEQVAPGQTQHTFWWTTLGLFEALESGQVETDFWLKQLLGRLDLQLKRLMDGSRQLAERLMRDVLYYQAILPAGTGRAAEVKSLFELQRHLPNAAASGGEPPHRPAVKLLRESLDQAKEYWLRYASGKPDALPTLQEVLGVCRKQAAQLGNPAIIELVDTLAQVCQPLAGIPEAMQNEGLHLELAASLLFAQNALDHFETLGDEFASQATLQCQRLRTALDPRQSLADLPSLPLLDDFSRQAQEKLLTAQVTQEIQANLHQVETILDAFFRNRAERRALPLVPGLMNQVLGALNMLQLDTAADLVRLGMDEIAVLSEPDRDISQEELDWIADAVSSLGLYVEALRHGRDDQASLRSLLAGPGAVHLDEASVESEVELKTADLQEKIEQWASGTETDTQAIKDDLARIAQDAKLIGDSALEEQADTALRMIESAATPESVHSAFQSTPPASPAPSSETLRLAEASTEEVDAELLGIYIAEAHEVLDSVAGHLAALSRVPTDNEAFVSIRRGFHTLKGSGRMVGLTAPAEISWEVEQTLNVWLHEAHVPTAEMLDFIQTAARAFRGWVEQLETQGHAQVSAADLVAQARRLRGEFEPDEEIELAPAVAQTVTTGVDGSFATEPEALAEADAEEALTRVGTHSLPTPLFDMFSAEAHQRLDDLDRHWGELRYSATPQGWEAFSRSAHTLAGIARTTGFAPLADGAHALEVWANDWALAGALADQAGDRPAAVLAELRRMYLGIVAGHYPDAADALCATLPGVPVQELPQAVVGPATPEAPADELDPELLQIFLAETDELLPRIGESLRAWRAQPQDDAPRQALQRALHTLKGSARMAGALALGDETHRVESRIIEHGEAVADTHYLESLEHDYDHLADLIDRLKPLNAAAPARAAESADPPEPAARPLVQEEDGRFRTTFKGRSIALDTLINETGEVSIARSRIENVLAAYKQSAEELTVNVERLRGQLRELELQAETQMHAHQSSIDESHFDPLEFDRYTRLQELTRLMAESVNDVATAQEGLLANLSEADGALLHQAKMTRSLQQQLMHIRMVPINSQAERLHRIVRQAAKETGHKARLHIEGGATELDRTVLDRVFASLEHLLRNAVVHGIEPVDRRKAASKPEYGDVRLSAKAEGNEVVLTLSDDGAGIDFPRVRQRAEALGWIKPGEDVPQDRLEAMLFLPGLSTAREVTQVAGRGIGLDVVKNDIAAMGGRVRLESESAAGSRFVIRLPLTLAVAPVVLARAGTQTYALPAILVALVREVRPEDWTQIAAAGHTEFEGQRYPLRTLAQLTGQAPAPLESRYRTLLLLRAGDERVALRVDALRGNTEAVIKNIGPQLARIPGVAGATVLGDGRVALILNPFALMERAPAATLATQSREAAELQEERAPLIMVVDDSLTVRKIASRLLTRQGYRVVTAKDGAEALELLQDERPGVMLLDIEMPRMDGFEVTRHVRADAKTQDLPIVMITSRTAEKHRLHAFELGVDTFMGKPFQDDMLLQEIDMLLHRASAA